MCSARRLIVLNIAVKIPRTVFNLQSGHEYIVEMTIYNVQRAIAPNTRVTAHVFCTSSYSALHLCEVW